MSFHRGVARLSRSSVLSQAIDSIIDVYAAEQCIQRLYDDRRRDHEQQHTSAIFEALGRRDARERPSHRTHIGRRAVPFSRNARARLGNARASREGGLAIGGTVRLSSNLHFRHVEEPMDSKQRGVAFSGHGAAVPSGRPGFQDRSRCAGTLEPRASSAGAKTLSSPRQGPSGRAGSTARGKAAAARSASAGTASSTPHDELPGGDRTSGPRRQWPDRFTRGGRAG